MLHQVGLLLLTAAAQQGALELHRLPPPVYQVTMEVTVNPEDRTLRGREVLRWQNTATQPTDELQFHLYLNAFANDRSTFFRESGGSLRNIGMPKDGWGFIVVDGIKTADGHDLKPTEEFLQPDDGNPDDRTVVRYRLPAPLAPGETVTLEINFHGRLPRVFARNGIHRDFILAAQWFPKIAVFEDAGVRGRKEAGWNCHQYHAHSEFYADSGNYDVTVVLPARYSGKIGATGRKVEEKIEADRVTARFVQEGVTDFAWTADPRYVVVEDFFDPKRDVPREKQQELARLLGVPPEELNLSPVAITLLLQPANRAQAQRYLEAVKVAMWGYGLRLGAYPYPHITLVDPPRGAMGAGGMEYMTFITLGTHPLFNLPFFREIRSPEGVTIHEFGHNYWMGMIASNEFEESWLDEGINSFYDMIIMDEVYGAEQRFLGLEVSAFESNRAPLRPEHYSDPMVRESWKFRPGTYGFHSYPRPAVTLKHLEGLVGPEAFHRAMRRFFREWQFRHPSSEDFIKSFRESVGQDLSWFFSQAFYSPAALDYGVRSVDCKKLGKQKGYVFGKGEPTLAPAEKEEKGSEGKASYRSRVVLERLGEFVHPVQVELVFADGSRQRHRWDGREKWTVIEVVTPSELVSAEVDPDHIMALDCNRLNNSKRVEALWTPVAKAVVHFMFWVQNVLSLAGLLG
ncbi:MAG: peptidase [Thermoanaerobaculum sp.]|nr:MAG: peptidase [Thermoanaerobaculum sp.]